MVIDIIQLEYERQTAGGIVNGVVSRDTSGAGRRREMGHVPSLLINALLSLTRTEWNVAFTITPSILPKC